MLGRIHTGSGGLTLGLSRHYSLRTFNSYYNHSVLLSGSSPSSLRSYSSAITRSCSVPSKHHGNSSLTSKSLLSSPYLPNGRISTRGFLSALSPLTAKLLLGATLPAAYVLFQLFQRRVLKQKEYVMSTFLVTPELLVHENALNRKEEVILRQYFNSPPSGPSVIIGPEGAGKNTLLKQVFRNRKMTLWLDLKQNPVVTGEDFLRLFIESTGYLLPTSGDSMWSILFLSINRRFSTNPVQDTDKALSTIADVLLDAKEKGWPDGVPVICVDDIHRLGSCNDLELPNRTVKLSDDKNFLKFVDWCIHVSDRKLAHVVFVTSYSFAHLDLDTHAGFRHRRSLISLYFSEPAIVRSFFEKVINTEQSKNPLSPEAIDTIVRCVGGQVEDVDRVVSGLRRGDSYINILRSMLTDSIALVEDHLYRILDEASKAPDVEVKHRVFERYMRFWKTMELLNTQESINKRQLVVNIYTQNADELENLVAAHILTIRNEEFPDSMSKKSDSIFSLLNSSLDSMAIAAGSPKLRTSFGLLLNDGKMIKQKNWVALQIDLKNLREKEKDIIERRKDLLTEVTQISTSLEKLVLNQEKWSANIGLDEFMRRKEFLIKREKEMEATIETYTTKLKEVRTEILSKTAPQ